MQLRALVFDWAGTVVDHGSLAPMGAFVETFGEFGVEIVNNTLVGTDLGVGTDPSDLMLGSTG